MNQRNDEFPDQRSLNHVRDALWRRPGQASVMIGSGFSRNARKNRPDAPDIPLWPDLAKTLAQNLSISGDNPASEGDALELAQEYEQAFGRARLHQFLNEAVRDEDFSPGELHHRLLRLPWRDVFSTNWDTLLEQCLPVPERAYSVVTSADHLPVGAPPRIVKLHGSFPGTFPLTVTRDDYEQYPERFAPFVNTVQQAMMETVFLLLGFSGADPNFRRWLGWVRGNLGQNAPRIYLAGWQDLDESSRGELMKENVVSINVRQHPKAANWPETLRHAKAVEWVLLSLEHGRPYPPEDWPSHVAPSRPSVPEGLEPVQPVLVKHPKEEPWFPEQGEPHDPAHLERIGEVLRIWSHNRKCYPSWLIMPSDAAHEMREKTNEWQPPILAALPHLADAPERLDALVELVWRREAALDPLFKDLEEAVAGVLEKIDCERRLVADEKRKDLDWGLLRSQWRTLAAALVTAARFNFDRERFEHWIKQLAPFMEEDQDLAERVEHEKCLWALNQQDYAHLQDQVGQWKPRATDPAWLLRKAALLAELGRNEKARELALGVLETVRRWSDDSGSLAGLSREAWALQFIHVTDDNSKNSLSRLRDLESRYRELAQYRCDPQTEFLAHEQAVVGSRQDEGHTPFDLGMTTGEGLSFSNAAHYRALAALRAIRFVEVVGSPGAFSYGLPRHAAEALRPYPVWTSALTVRSADGGADRQFSRTLSRWRIAFMAPELANSLAAAQRRTIAFALEKLQGSGDAGQSRLLWGKRLEAAMEALSRFVLRLKPEEVESALQLAQSLYGNPLIRKRIFLGEPLAHLLRRSWEALPGSLRERHALDLLRLPIVGVDDFLVANENDYLDPGYILDAGNLVRDCPAPARSEANESAWIEVARLVEQGLGTGGTARNRAAVRLAVLSRWQRLTSDERQRLASSLWDFGLDCDGLPRDADLHQWVFPTLPEPEPKLAETRLRAAWVRSSGWEEESRESLERVLADAGAALERLPALGQEIELTDTEVDSLRAAVDRWAAMGPTEIGPWEREDEPQWRRTLRNIANLLLELNVSSGTAEALRDNVQKLGTGRTPAFELLPGIVKSDQELADAAASLLRVGLGGSTPKQREQALSACVGLFLWLRASTLEDSRLPQPPDHLVLEMGIAIAAHRWFLLSQALEIAAWVFEKGTAEHRELLRSPVLGGLEFLRRALVFREITPHPFVEQPQVSEDDVDVPLLRWRCVQLAKAMDSAGFGDEAAVTGWLEDAGNDPLPELRFAVEDWQDGRVSKNPPDPD